MNALTRGASATLAGLLATAAGSVAGAPHILLPSSPGVSISYDLQFDGSFWNGQRVVFDRTATITVGNARSVRIVTAGKSSTDNASAAGKLAADGTIDSGDAGNRIDSFNTVAGLLASAPPLLQPGATWNGQVPIETGDSGQIGYLPVQLKIVSAGSGGAVIQGTGSQTLTASYAGYTVPIDVTAQFALRVAPAGFDRCDFAASELVNAGPQTQTMRWSGIWRAPRRNRSSVIMRISPVLLAAALLGTAAPQALRPPVDAAGDSVALNFHYVGHVSPDGGATTLSSPLHVAESGSNRAVVSYRRTDGTTNTLDASVSADGEIVSPGTPSDIVTIYNTIPLVLRTNIANLRACACRLERSRAGQSFANRVEKRAGQSRLAECRRSRQPDGIGNVL